MHEPTGSRQDWNALLRRCEQPAVAGYAVAHAGQSQRMPHHSRGGGNHRLAEVLLEDIQDLDGWHAGPAKENRLRRRFVYGAAKLVGPLRCLLVDVRHILEAGAADHLEPASLQVRFALERRLLAEGRA